MNKIVRLLKTWILPDLAIVLFCLFVLALIGGTAAWQITRDRDTTISQIAQDGDQYARVLEEHTRQLLKNNDRYITMLKNEYQQGGVSPALLRVVHQVYLDPAVSQLVFIGPDGEAMSNILARPRGLNFSRDPQFTTHAFAGTHGLFIGRPSPDSVTGARYVPLSRRLDNPDGSFGGVVAIAILTDRFTRFYQDIDFSERYTVRIIGLDGFLLAGSSIDNYGVDVSAGPIFRELAKAPDGFYLSSGFFSGIPKYVNYRLMPDYSLVVQVGVSEAALAPMFQRRAGYLGAAGIASLFVVLYTAGLISRTRRQREAEARYSKAFRVSPDAISINRLSDGRFIEINEGFIVMHGFARDEVIGRSVLELGIWVNPADRSRLVAGLARYGEVIDLEAKFHRKDGTVLTGLMSAKTIEVAGEACLLTVTRDITERKQAEEKLNRHKLKLEAAYMQLAATEEELRAQYDEVVKANAQIKEQNDFLFTLQQVTVGLINEIELEPLLQKIVDEAAALAGANGAFIALPSADGTHLETKAGRGLYKEYDGVWRVPIATGLMGKVLATGQAEYIDDYQAWEDRARTKGAEQISAIFAGPLKFGKETIGVLGVAYTNQRSEFTPTRRELLERLGDLATVVLEKAKLHAALQASYMELTASHEELTANHEELVANDQELRRLLEEVMTANIRVEESYHTIEDIFNAIRDGIVVNDETGKILTVNRQLTDMFGYTAEEFKELGAAAIASSANVGDALERIRKTVAGVPQLYERETTDRFGGPLILEIKSSPVVIEGKTRSVALIRDISARRRMEADLARSLAQKLATYDAIPDLVVLLSRDGIVLDHNAPPGFCDGLGETVITGLQAAEVFPPAAARELTDLIGQVLATGKTCYYEFEWKTATTSCSLEVRLVRVDADKALALFRNITEKRKMEERLEFLSLHDSLTGAYNRAYFEEAIQRLRSRGHTGIGVFVCDVDGLKLINDTLGHRYGDDLLRKVAAILNNGIKLPNFIARIGGDEFAVILYEPTKQKMEALAQRYRKSVARYNKESPHLPLSLSVGWAAAFDTTQVDSVFKEADNNMYRQKMHQGHSIRGAIVQTMMKALEARDYLTEGHAERLGDLMEKMGQRLQMPQGALADLRLFAKFHDIGKVGIPDSILNKPGRLTIEEMAIMQRHCEIGFRIARSSPDLAPIADWVLKHQEHWNGRGYPLGLAGEDIPIQCRILALVDAFDAMTNDRPYRQAMGWQDALAEIERCAGSQFDPELAAVFVAMIEEEMN